MQQLNSSPTLIRNLETAPIKPKMKLPIFLLLVVAAVILGVGVGYLPKAFSRGETSDKNTATAVKTAGITDKKTFKDSAEGILREGGIDGEGNYHLERPGGKSQNVYLTSTTVDLSTYVGKKIRVGGQTFEAQTAGWFMDVGYVEPIK
ncbi:MAG: hypothetical protein ACOYUB_03740 [Patescibacteria group bacterium]